MIRHYRFRWERVFKALPGDDFTILPEQELQCVFSWRINAGRQLFVCIHLFLLIRVNTDRLSEASGRGRQTYRPEIMRAASGILTRATVRPAPFSEYLRNAILFHRLPEVRHD